MLWRLTLVATLGFLCPHHLFHAIHIFLPPSLIPPLPTRSSASTGVAIDVLIGAAERIWSSGF